MVAMFDLVGVPYAYYVPHENPPELFQMVRYATDAQIWRAYWLTVWGTVMVIAFALLFGVTKGLSELQWREPAPMSEKSAAAVWWTTFLLQCGAIAVMFIQAGFSVPMLTLGNATLSDYQDSALLRSYYAGRIDMHIFNVNLLWFSTLNLATAFDAVRSHKWFHRIISVAMFVLSASFSLAKSPIGAALVVMTLFVAVRRPVSVRTVTAMALAIVICIAPFYLIYAYTADAMGVVEMLAERIFYGQWAGLPYYFIVFDEKPVSIRSLLPPYVQKVTGGLTDTPGRQLMLFLEPSAAVEGVAGNIPSFFIGEAYAVAGFAGVMIAPIVAVFELWLMVSCFRLLPKNLFTQVLLAWFLYRFAIGLLDGASFMLVSGFSICLAALVGFTIVRVACRAQKPTYA